MLIKGRFLEAQEHFLPTLRCYSSLDSYITEALPNEQILTVAHLTDFLLQTLKPTLAIKLTTIKEMCTYLASALLSLSRIVKQRVHDLLKTLKKKRCFWQQES